MHPQSKTIKYIGKNLTYCTLELSVKSVWNFRSSDLLLEVFVWLSGLSIPSHTAFFVDVTKTMSSTTILNNDDDQEDERLGGPNKCGRKFIEYWTSSDRGDQQCSSHDEIAKHVPSIDIKYKVYRLSDFNQVEGTIFVTFVLCLDWHDPSLALVPNGQAPDFYEHFWPKPELQGNLSCFHVCFLCLFRLKLYFFFPQINLP